MKLVLTCLKTVFRKDVSTKIKTILEELKPISDDPMMRRLIRMTWCYLVSSAKHMERSYEILYDTIKNIVEVETMPTMLEKWTAEAVAAGRKDMVLTFLRAKFGNIPEEMEAAILAITDLTALKSLAAQAAHCQSLDEFAKTLE